MKDLPYMKWYPSDVETDESWMLMKMAERGLYITLLNYSWINRGVPNESWKIARIAGITEAELAELWPYVSKKFSADESGRLVNDRQEEERVGAATKSLKCSANAAHSGERKRPGFVYLIRRSSDGSVKIGSSANVGHRFSQLKYKYQTDQLTLLAQISAKSMGDLEIALQEKYAHLRVSGEWFALSEEDVRSTTLEGDIFITPLGDRGDHPALRAFDSDSNYDSSTNNHTPTENNVVPKVEPVDTEFSGWAELRHFVHPNSRDKFLNLQAMTRRFALDQEARGQFTTNHDLWVKTEKWQEKQGAFAPRLWQWIDDDGWKKPPPRPPKKETALERMIREEKEKKANVDR